MAENEVAWIAWDHLKKEINTNEDFKNHLKTTIKNNNITKKTIEKKPLDSSDYIINNTLINIDKKHNNNQYNIHQTYINHLEEKIGIRILFMYHRILFQ